MAGATEGAQPNVSYWRTPRLPSGPSFRSIATRCQRVLSRRRTHNSESNGTLLDGLEPGSALCGGELTTGVEAADTCDRDVDLAGTHLPRGSDAVGPVLGCCAIVIAERFGSDLRKYVANACGGIR